MRAGSGIRSSRLRLRADGQRQGQIMDRRPHPRLAGRVLVSPGGPKIRVVLTRESTAASRAGMISRRSGQGLARADGAARAQESSGTSAPRSLDSGHFRRISWKIGKGLTMRFGKWRGLPLALALAAIVGVGPSRVRADGWHLHDTIPREVPTYDYTTGGPYFAPPVPYGHYAKDYHDEALKAVGYLYGPLKDLWDKTVGLFHCCGEGCGHGHGCGHGCGDGQGHGCGLSNGCGMGSGCGFYSGRGLFGHAVGYGTGSHGAGSGNCLALSSGLGSGLGHRKHFAPCHASTVVATAQVQPAGQAVVSPSAQAMCGNPGCKIAGHHSHIASLTGKIRCRFCGGAGCGGCGGMGLGDPCSGCGGSGLFGGLGHDGASHACGACGGCGLGNHSHGTGCGHCGGKGCSHCLAGLGAHAHGLLSHLAGSTLGLLHHDKFDYFVGPGGPVPLTPGYVPYIVATRSPRDFFAFPPMNPNDP